MKMRNTTLCMMLLAACSTQLNAQADRQPSAEEKAWMEFMTPGKNHQMLAKSDGEWNQEITMWMDPAAPPTKSTSTCTNTMIMGGRYQQSMTKGNFQGMPFEGMSVTGYDNAKNMFVSTWIDNMGTGIMSLEGPYNEASKTVMLKGKYTDPMTKKEERVREVWKMIDDNTQFMEMYMTKNGKEYKSMEMKITRKQ